MNFPKEGVIGPNKCVRKEGHEFEMQTMWEGEMDFDIHTCKHCGYWE